MTASSPSQTIIPSLELIGGTEGNRDAIASHLELGYLFRELEWAQINTLAGYMGLYRAPPGATIFREGDKGDYLCVLVEGQLEMYKEDNRGDLKRVAVMNAGKTIGEMAMVDGEPRSATAVVGEPVLLAVLTRANFALLSLEKPALAMKIMSIIARTLSQRLRQTSGELMQYIEIGE